MNVKNTKQRLIIFFNFKILTEKPFEKNSIDGHVKKGIVVSIMNVQKVYGDVLVIDNFNKKTHSVMRLTELYRRLNRYIA